MLFADAPFLNTAPYAARRCLCILLLFLLAVFPDGGYSGELPELHSGYVIFREGTEPISDAVTLVDGDKYSHVGILIGKPGQWQVLHAVPAELPERRDAVVIDDLAFFTDPGRARQYAIYRVNASEEEYLSAIRFAMTQEGRPFRISDPEGIYCTTLIWQMWQKAGVDLEVSFSQLNIPLLQGNYLLPGKLRQSPRLVQIYESHPDPGH